MKTITFDELITSSSVDGAIIRNDFPGFKEDYLAIHAIIKKYNPTTLMEIGTSSGSGTKVICNAMGLKRFWWNRKKNIKKVYSIDVPVGSDPKIIYPDSEDGHPFWPGIKCNFPYTQIFGDSTKFDFSPYYPLEAWFIDGKHNYEYAKRDTLQALKSNPKLIIWHDMQIDGVNQAVTEIFNTKNDYDLWRITGSRIAFVIKNS